MPNFQDKVEKWNLEPEIDGLTQEDGKYYLLPGLHEELWPDYSLAVRTDILAEGRPRRAQDLGRVPRRAAGAQEGATPTSSRSPTASTATAC